MSVCKVIENLTTVVGGSYRRYKWLHTSILFHTLFLFNVGS